MDLLDLMLGWHATPGLSPDGVELAPAYIHREQTALAGVPREIAGAAYIHREQASVAER